MAVNQWKKWEKDMAKWVIQYLAPWQKANPGKDWVSELYNQQQAHTAGGDPPPPPPPGGIHPPPPPPVP